MHIDPIIAAVRDAAQLCRTIQSHSVQGINKFSQAKGSSEPVTIGDYGSQALIGRALMSHFPDDAAIAEESGHQFATLVAPDKQREVIAFLQEILGEPVTVEDVVSWLDFGKDRTAARTWVIDPIDGTRGFIAGRHYSICVGTLENGIPTDAVMACPHYKDGVGAIFYTRDSRVYRTDIEGNNAQPVQVSTRQQPSEWIAVQSYEDSNRGKKDAVKVVTEAELMPLVAIADFDSMEKYALVACGDADFLIRLPERSRTSPHMIWDHVAGVALVLAGGGVATDFDGSPLDFTQGKILPNQGMFVSSGIMHEQIATAARTVIGVGTKVV